MIKCVEVTNVTIYERKYVLTDMLKYYSLSIKKYIYHKANHSNNFVTTFL